MELGAGGVGEGGAIFWPKFWKILAQNIREVLTNFDWPKAEHGYCFCQIFELTHLWIYSDTPKLDWYLQNITHFYDPYQLLSW